MNSATNAVLARLCGGFLDTMKSCVMCALSKGCGDSREVSIIWQGSGLSATDAGQRRCAFLSDFRFVRGFGTNRKSDKKAQALAIVGNATHWCKIQKSETHSVLVISGFFQTHAKGNQMTNTEKPTAAEKRAKSIDERIAAQQKKLRELMDEKKEVERKSREKNQKAVLELIQVEGLDSVPTERWQAAIAQIKALLVEPARKVEEKADAAKEQG